MILIRDEETVQGVKIFHDGVEALVNVGVDRNFAMSLRNLFGPSGICNVLGAIKLAKFLRLGQGDNVVTIATNPKSRGVRIRARTTVAITWMAKAIPPEKTVIPAPLTARRLSRSPSFRTEGAKEPFSSKGFKQTPDHRFRLLP